jgi:lipid kinase YegS
MMATMRLILNGKSSGRPDVREAVRAVRDEGHCVEVRVTWEAGDAGRYAQQAADEGIGVVAGGGDGTVNEVVGGVCQAAETSPTAVGLLPLGTANDFAHGCGIDCDDLTAALRLAATGKATPIDVGVCNERLFINVASGGFGAQVTATTPPRMKDMMGGAAYSLMGLVTALQMSPYRGTLITPEERIDGEMLLMAVSNGRQAGGGYVVGPGAFLNDGLLDVLVVPNVAIDQLGPVLRDLVNLGKGPLEHVYYRRLASLEIHSEQPLYMNLDGEPMLDTHFRFRVLPKRLRLVLPECTAVVQV